MPKIIFYLIFIVFFFSSCAPNGNVVSTSGLTPVPIPTSITPGPVLSSLGKCTDVRSPTPDPNETSLFPAIGTQDHILGSTLAPVTILVYSDFQCASCADLASLLNSYVRKYPKDIRLVFRNFPLVSIHDKAALSAQAAEAASLQGKFWEMHDFLFSKQAEWVNQEPSDFQKWVIQESDGLALDRPRLASDLTSPAIISRVQKDWEDGQKIKLPGAPIILINGEIIKWKNNLFEQLESLVKLAILTRKQFSSCPPVLIDLTKHYSATLITSKGAVKINLFVDRAPNTVNNFVFLAKNGWFNNIPFHRVISGFVVQTGDPTGTGLGGPGYFIPSEKNNLVYDRSGMVGMVNSGPDTNGSQFFITLSPAPHLNYNYPIFGQVASGMEILTSLAPQDPAAHDEQKAADTLISVTIEEK